PVQRPGPGSPGGGENSASNAAPALTARSSPERGWGHFSVAGLLRQLEYGEETETGAALSVSGKFNLGPSDDIRYMVNYGNGIGRYMAFGLGADAEEDASGRLHALDGHGGFVAWRHVFSPKLRGNLMYSAARFDNTPDWVGWAVTEGSESIHANLIYSPFPK